MILQLLYCDMLDMYLHIRYLYLELTKLSKFYMSKCSSSLLHRNKIQSFNEKKNGLEFTCLTILH